MRQNCTHFVCVFVAVFTAMLLTACASDLLNGHKRPVDEVVVGFSTSGTQTKTTMLPNGLSAAWEADDRLAVWAKGSSGSYVLSNQIFETYGIDDSRGFFTSRLASEMPQDTYTYYCCYPAPVSVNGTTATFNIPSTQDGKATGGADIMIATPVQYGPLKPLPDPEDHSNMVMSMNRMMHQFRFYIPENNDLMASEEIVKMELSFPRAVAGTIEMNLADPAQKANLTGTSSVITLPLAEPLKISAESRDLYEYACVALAPIAFAAGESVSIKAYTRDRIAKVDPIDLRSKDMQPGHSTPVKLIVKDIVDYPYNIRFTLASNNVGEPVNLIKFTAPSGCIWPDSGTNEYVFAPGRDIPVGETVMFRFENYEDYVKFSGQPISIVLETENAISTSTATVASIPANVQTHTSDISASMPYLLYQDFSSIATYNDGHDNPGVGTDSDTYKGITELTSAGLPGWYGTRIGISGGQSARICCRYEHVLLAGAYYKGRLYTPPLSMLKEGSDVKISVSFKHGSNRNERKADGFIGIGGKKPDKSPILYFGINTQDVVTNPDQSEGNIIDSITGMIAGSGFSSSTPTSLSPMVIKGEYLDKENGSYTSLPKSKTIEIENVDRYMRLGWILTTDNEGRDTNANYWLYIDEIKVQIAK